MLSTGYVHRFDKDSEMRNWSIITSSCPSINSSVFEVMALTTGARECEGPLGMGRPSGNPCIFLGEVESEMPILNA